MIKAEAILPKPFRGDVFLKNFEKAGKDWAEGVNQDFARSHRDFSAKSKPQHKTAVKATPRRITVTVEITGKIYQFVHDGTKPHPIRAKRGKKLAFQSGYRPKTAVGYIASFPGGPFGPVAYAQQVDHPGFRGRQQSKAIKANQEKPFFDEMEEALKKSVKECGHGA